MKIKRVAALVLGGLFLTLPLAACGGEGGGGGQNVTVQVWAPCDGDEATRMKLIESAFNEKYAEQGIRAKFTQRPDTSYETTMKPTLSGGSAPDVFIASDNYWKQWVGLGYMENLDPYIYSDDSLYNMADEVADMYTGSVYRYHYDPVTATQDSENAHYYGLPKGTDVCSIYYNATYMANAGVKIISVYEEELEAFNGGEADARGNTKSSLGITAEVKAVGYDAENKIFNNRIPMNWEECATLADLLMNNGKNKAAGCAYGYLAEWWFNYGFSVGGDCVGYIPTSDTAYNGGYYTFTMGDATVNYKVKEGETVTVGETTYPAGELISFYDKFSLTDEAAAKCDVLPSQRQAFTEYLSLSAPKTSDALSGKAGVADEFPELIPYKIEGGLPVYEQALKQGTDISTAANTYRTVKIENKGVSPNPSSFSTNGKAGYFIAGKVAMLVDIRGQVSSLRVGMRDNDWDCAPMLVYRGTDREGNVVEGNKGAHSGSKAWCVWSKSKVKEAAYLFVKFATGEEGQRILADAGTIIMNERAVAEEQIKKEVASGLKPLNAEIMIEAVEWQTPADWWYLSDGDWIDAWAAQVNSNVRNGRMTLAAFYGCNDYSATFDTLLKYTRAK